MVGNPYPFSFNLGDVDQTLFCGPLDYSNNDGWSDYKTTITPFGGYIICNKADTTVVLTAIGSDGSQRSSLFSSDGSKDRKKTNNKVSAMKAEKLFRARVSFSSMGYSDNNNFIGIHPRAENDFDMYDNVTEPLVPNNDDRIKFDWMMEPDSDQPKYLLQDIKYSGDSTFTWLGYLHPNKNREEITISIALEGETDAGNKMIMVDRSNGDKFNLLDQSYFKLKKGYTNMLGRKFTILYGPSSWVDFQVDELIASIPTDYILAQNYPNPFNPVTSINYEIPTDQRVTLSVYNILGQEVVRLVNKEQFAGKYTIRWNGTSNRSTTVSSGTYFYVLQTNNFKQVKKMVLLK